MQQPTFLKLFADDDERSTEYLAIDTITEVKIEITPVERRPPTISVVIGTSNGARRVVTGREAKQLIKTLDSLSPASTAE